MNKPHKHDLLMHRKWFRLFSWAALTCMVSFSVFLVEHNATVLRTSLIPTPTHKPFDGTVYPIAKVPNWAQLSSSEYDNSYTSIPASKLIDVPYYNSNDFHTSFDELKWGDPATEDLRNSKITYSVPYMGDYSLDSVEYSGSHLAVDIKVPTGTPVFSIGNGVVVKVSNISSGFGHHIVIEHKNFPTMNSENKLTTYYASYSHLSTILVAEGQVVDKGDQIALSGATGTATTPHLHFQMDNDEVDWHPYWPFTWQESSDAGLSFFEAVNDGLGYDRAVASTVNPMKYVQKYLDPSATVVENAATHDEEPEVADQPVYEPVVVDEPADEPAVVNEPAVETYTPPTTSNSGSAYSLTFKIVVGSEYEEGETAYFTVYVNDEDGDAYAGSFDGVIKLSLNNDIGEISDTKLTDDDVSGGKVKLNISDLEVGKSKIKLSYGDKVKYSNWFEVEKSVAPKVEVGLTSFTDVPKSHSNYEAITYLAENGVISGYPDGTFKPDDVVTRAEALKFVLEGIHAQIEESKLPYKDVSNSAWYYKYVSTAHLRSIVAGYDDGNFKASNVVSRSEFLKILFTAMEADIPRKVNKDPFVDVDKDDWFAPYFEYAKEEEILDSQLRAWPSTGMKRADVAEAMYRVMAD